MQRAPTSRKSGSNAPYRPINFGGAPEAEIRGSEGNGRMHKPDRRRALAPLAASRDGEINMKRREFITLLGGAAAWPLVARAQQGERMRRIGVLMIFAERDPEAKAWLTAFQDRLQQLGWVQGRNLSIDYRWADDDLDRLRTYAAELVRMAPD